MASTSLTLITMADNQRSEIVSDDSELLILVDDEDRELGHLNKAACHNDSGILHRAFSLFIFNSDGELLLQQRAPEKRLWGGYWSNSCCSHPRKNETMAEAVTRRCEQELGFSTDLNFVYKFKYQAEFANLGSEHELCSVYIGQFHGHPEVNSNEVSAWRWVQPDLLDRELADSTKLFTPWLKLEWQRLNKDFPNLFIAPK